MTTTKTETAAPKLTAWEISVLQWLFGHWQHNPILGLSYDANPTFCGAFDALVQCEYAVPFYTRRGRFISITWRGRDRAAR